MSEIAPPVAFDEMKAFRSRMACLIQPELAISASGFHDESVSLPLADGKSLPRGPRDILWKRAAISEDLAEVGPGFVQNHGHHRGLKDLQRVGSVGLTVRPTGKQ